MLDNHVNDNERECFLLYKILVLAFKTLLSLSEDVAKASIVVG